MLAALALGVAGGLSPGPLHSLILATALRDGPRAGARIAVAPLLSDIAPVGASLVLAAALPEAALGWMSVVGGVVLVGMAARSLRDRGPEVRASAGADYLKGAVTNVLNPNPWIFWLGAGAPLLAAAFDAGVWAGVGWLVVFYVGLVGVKVGFALGVGYAGAALSPTWLRRSLVASAVLMAGVGVWLVALGVTHL